MPKRPDLEGFGDLARAFLDSACPPAKKKTKQKVKTKKKRDSNGRNSRAIAPHKQSSKQPAAKRTKTAKTRKKAKKKKAEGGGNVKRISKSERARYRAWLDSFEEVSEWMDQYDIFELLEANGGLVRIENFLPEFVARGALDWLESKPDDEWTVRANEDDEENFLVQHHFFVGDAQENDDTTKLARVMSLLIPEKPHVFSAGKYLGGDHISDHDDAAFADVRMEDGSVVLHSRDIALVFYLTKDWTEADGGALIDIETGNTLLPKFNSLVAFKVPRFHEVEAVTGGRPRYSIFGWFLEPGDIYGGEDDDDDDDDDDVGQKHKKKGHKKGAT